MRSLALVFVLTAATTTSALAARTEHTLQRARAQVDALKAKDPTTLSARRGPPLGQALVHVAQTLDYTRTGFPKALPRPVQVVIGKPGLALSKAAGRLVIHTLRQRVPGAPKIARDTPVADGIAEVDRALGELTAHLAAGKPIHPHPMFGELSASDAAWVQAAHIDAHKRVIVER